MELDQLRNFLRVAERQNFTRAAEDLAMSQPALSRSIQRLEEELGQPVFERKTRSVSLTDAGLLLQSRAQQVLAILEDTRAEITDDGQSGRIRVGAIPTIAPYFLPEVLQRFSREFPKATLLVQENTTDTLLMNWKLPLVKRSSIWRFSRFRFPRGISMSTNCLRRNCCSSCRRNIRSSGRKPSVWRMSNRFPSYCSTKRIV